MGWALRGQRTAEVIFDFRTHRGILLRELHSDAGLTIALGARGCQLDDFSRDWKLFRFIHQGEKQQNLLT